MDTKSKISGWVIAALVLINVCAAGFLGWQLWNTREAHRLRLEPEEIAQIAVDVGGEKMELKWVTLTAERDIRDFCRQWNAMWVAEVPSYEGVLGHRDVPELITDYAVRITGHEGDTVAYTVGALYVTGEDMTRFWIHGEREDRIMDWLDELQETAYAQEAQEAAG